MRPNRITLVCEVCGEPFQEKPSVIARGGGRGRFCSSACQRNRPDTNFERLWPKVEKTETCWLFAGPFNHNGYGLFRLSSGKMVRIHRWIYEQLVGPIPEGLLVLHRCDVPRCVNPDHLFLGTQKDNIRDMMAKGRDPDRRPGEASNFAKITAETVIEIRRRYAEGGVTQRELGEMFGLTQPGVGFIVRRERWKHIT